MRQGAKSQLRTRTLNFDATGKKIGIARGAEPARLVQNLVRFNKYTDIKKTGVAAYSRLEFNTFHES